MTSPSGAFRSVALKLAQSLPVPFLRAGQSDTGCAQSINTLKTSFLSRHRNSHPRLYKFTGELCHFLISLLEILGLNCGVENATMARILLNH